MAPGPAPRMDSRDAPAPSFAGVVPGRRRRRSACCSRCPTRCPRCRRRRTCPATGVAWLRRGLLQGAADARARRRPGRAAGAGAGRLRLKRSPTSSCVSFVSAAEAKDAITRLADTESSPAAPAASAVASYAADLVSTASPSQQQRLQKAISKDTIGGKNCCSFS